MPYPVVRQYRWDEIASEKVTEMISRKIVTGEREMLAQIWLKKGAIVPIARARERADDLRPPGRAEVHHRRRGDHVREGEVLHIPSSVPHQAEALDDTFELDVFSPIRQDWLDKTDDYFRR